MSRPEIPRFAAGCVGFSVELAGQGIIWDLGRVRPDAWLSQGIWADGGADGWLSHGIWSDDGPQVHCCTCHGAVAEP